MWRRSSCHRASSPETSNNQPFSSQAQFALSSTLSVHSQELTCLATLYSENSSHLLATASSDGTIRLYKLSPGNDSCFQTLEIGSKYALALEFALLPGSSVPVLFVAGTDKAITLFVLQDQEVSFIFPLLYILVCQECLSARPQCLDPHPLGYSLYRTQSKCRKLCPWRSPPGQWFPGQVYPYLEDIRRRPR